MSKIKEYISLLQSNNVPFEKQEEALREIEKVISEAKVEKEQKINQNIEFIVSAFKTIEKKINKKYEEILNVSIKKGEQGPEGKAGKDGKDGLNGRDGRNGIDGKDGEDGKDGTGVVDAYVDFDGSLIIKLSDGTDIDAGRVVSEAVAKEFNTFMTRGDILPAQTDNSGKYLTTDGNNLSWATVSAGDALPDQTGNNGKYLTTDGTSPSWATLDVGNLENFSKLNLMGL
jgi:hypothetical protein